MQLFSSLLFGVSASLDALLLGITYGIRKVHIKLWQNLFISLITLLGTCISVGFGSWLGPLLPVSLGKWIGSITLMAFGIYYLLKFMIPFCKRYLHNFTSLQKSKLTKTGRPGETHETSACSCEPSASPASMKNVLFLGVSLSANNIGIGLGASIAGLSLLSAAITTFLFSAVFLSLGNRMGRGRLSDLLGYTADPISGLLLLGLGACELFF